MDHNSFILYNQSEELIAMLSDEECGKLMRALFVYARTKEQPTLPPIAKVVFTTMRQYMDENDRKWDETKEKRREAGRRGAQTRWAEEKQENAAEDPMTDDDRAMQVMTDGDGADAYDGCAAEDMANDSCAAEDMANDSGAAEDPMANDGCAINTMANIAVYDSVSASEYVNDSVSDSESDSESVSVFDSDSDSVSVSESVPVTVSESEVGSDPVTEDGAHEVWETDNPYVQNVRDHLAEWKEKYRHLWEQRQTEQEQETEQNTEQEQDLERTDEREEKTLEFFESDIEQMNRRTLAECYCDAKQRDYTRTEEPRTTAVSPVSSQRTVQSAYAIPTLEAVEQLCRREGLHTDPRRFYAINEKSGWTVNGRPMRDWQAALRAWSKKDEARQNEK